MCMKNNWLMLLGSSGAMNLGLTWLMTLDPDGTRSPFWGPRWYNKTCLHNSSAPCDKEWSGPRSLSFVNFQNMALDLILDADGNVIYKVSADVKSAKISQLSEAPEVPTGGWRMTALPVQYAHEVLSRVQAATTSMAWRGPPPIIYAQVGQWYLNAFDGRSRLWGLNTTEVKALEQLRDPNALFQVYYDDMMWLVEALQKLQVQAIALGTMPVSKHRCRKRDGLGCRRGLNRMIDLVLQRAQKKVATAAPDKEKNTDENDTREDIPPVFAVDWASTSVGEQGGAHTDHKAALLGIQRLLSVLCPPVRELAGQIAADDAVSRMDASRKKAQVHDARPADPPRRPAAVDEVETCARVGVFSRSCGPDHDWRVEIARRCNVTTLPIDAHQAVEMLNNVGSQPLPASLDGLRITPVEAPLPVAYTVQEEPTSAALLQVWQWILLSLSVAVLAHMLSGTGGNDREAMTPKLSAQCSEEHHAATASVQERGDAHLLIAGGTEVFEKHGKVRGNRKRLDAITGARLVASLHVAATHLARLSPPAAPAVYQLSWGFTWVPWFFMLSGYILAYVRLVQPNDSSFGESVRVGGVHSSQLCGWGFCHRRLAAIYPLYLVGMFMSLGMLAVEGKLFTIRPWALATQVGLMQAWFPAETEHALQTQCWFLSAMIPFWLLHERIVSNVERIDTRGLIKLLVLLALLPWVLLWLLPGLLGVGHDWYAVHRWQSFAHWGDLLVVALKFHPLCYLHIYVFGVALAVWHARQQAQDEPVWWLQRNGASVAYACLASIFSLPALCPPGHELLYRLGGLTPLQGLLLIGLSGLALVASVVTGRLRCGPNSIYAVVTTARLIQLVVKHN